MHSKDMQKSASSLRLTYLQNINVYKINEQKFNNHLIMPFVGNSLFIIISHFHSKTGVILKYFYCLDHIPAPADRH